MSLVIIILMKKTLLAKNLPHPFGMQYSIYILRTGKVVPQNPPTLLFCEYSI